MTNFHLGVIAWMVFSGTVNLLLWHNMSELRIKLARLQDGLSSHDRTREKFIQLGDLHGKHIARLMEGMRIMRKQKTPTE